MQKPNRICENDFNENFQVDFQKKKSGYEIPLLQFNE